MKSEYVLSLTDEERDYVSKNIEKANEIYYKTANNSEFAKENHECPCIETYVKSL